MGQKLSLSVRLTVAIALTIAMAVFQWTFWDQFFEPYAWYLFLPTVFASATLTGRAGGFVSTALGVVIISYLFILPETRIAPSPVASITSILAYGAMGAVISIVIERLHRATQIIGERLDESETRFRATFDQAAVGIAHVGTDGKWLQVNKRLSDILGYTHPELMAKTFQEITHPDDLNSDMGLVKQVLAGEIDTYTMEKRYLTKAGTYLWANLTVSLVPDDSGKPDYFISVIEDISSRKASEQENERLKADLEARVAQRTHELEVANKELESFAYAVSHDLRAPLRAMSGFSKALQEDYAGKLDGEAAVYLEQIFIAAQRMDSLISGILQLSRSTREPLRIEAVDVSAVCGRLLQGLAAEGGPRDVAVDVEPGLTVRADPRMIEAVLSNLIGNAWKYTGKTEKARISVRSGHVGNLRAICIADNGAGFDMAHAERLFKPFQRLHRQDEFPGIGIGLATSQRIIHRHGGEIVAQASPGRGATFCFTIPELPLMTNTPRGIHDGQDTSAG